mmetsp:Transcript_7127/g.23516  ORF Transcript_7127/g.23516 Transcript_7127/m.23516 type:complete len:202 (+) Transcript_7127:1596-2201(+)
MLSRVLEVLQGVYRLAPPLAGDRQRVRQAPAEELGNLATPLPEQTRRRQEQRLAAVSARPAEVAATQHGVNRCQRCERFAQAHEVREDRTKAGASRSARRPQRRVAIDERLEKKSDAFPLVRPQLLVEPRLNQVGVVGSALARFAERPGRCSGSVASRCSGSASSRWRWEGRRRRIGKTEERRWSKLPARSRGGAARRWSD